MVGAGGENWVLGKALLAINYDPGFNQPPAMSERNAALALLRAHITAQGEVLCDACSGYGHALAVCPTYARTLQAVAGNPPMQKVYRGLLVEAASRRKKTVKQGYLK